jgi:hypothetical protein
MEILDSLLAITRCKLFLEPTNHENLSHEDMMDRYNNSPLSSYNSRVLTVTDYQNRLLYMVEK